MLNKALRSVRKFHCVSVQDAAAQMGVSPSYVSEIENGKKRVHQDMLESYSKLFDMPISSFYLIAEEAPNSIPKKTSAVRRKINKIVRWIAED